MPLLDIAIAQFSFPNYLGYPRVQLFVNGDVHRSSLHCEERWASLWKSFQYPGNSKFYLGHCTKPHPNVLIKAISPLEQKCPHESEDGHKENRVLSSTVVKLSSTINIDSSNEDLEDVNDREKLRRIRISKANKGITPWNKGSKHSTETVQLIRERTRLAMQDPKEYRSKVRSGMAKYYGTPEGAERRAQKKPSREGQTANTPKNKANKPERSAINEFKTRAQEPKLKKRTTTKFKDPLACTKLEMLKSIRAQRAVSESKNEALQVLQRAELLIKEAEKAAKALELAAMKSPVAQASLMETRKLIAEAMQSMETIKNRQVKSQADISSKNQSFVEENAEALTEDLTQDQESINGVASPQLGGGHLNPYKLTTSMLEEIDVDYQLPTNLIGYELHKLGVKGVTEKAELGKVKYHRDSKPNGAVRLTGISSPNRAKLQNHHEQIPVTAKAVTKKWVRGRLVEVSERE